MAGGVETDDRTICGNALRTSVEKKHLIEASVRKCKPVSYKLFFAPTIAKRTRVDVAKFSSAPCTLCLNIEAQMYA